MDKEGLVFANLVDFDVLYGHRNNPQGYAGALESFDQRLSKINQSLSRKDVLNITANHRNDPTTSSTDHSRERVPILLVGESERSNLNIGTLDSFTEVAASIVTY